MVDIEKLSESSLKLYLDINKRTIITLYSKIKNENKRILNDAFLLLQNKIFTLFESIIILCNKNKYVESHMLLRNQLETGIFIKYLSRYPFEIKRWISWDKMDYSQKENIPTKYNDFITYLKNNGFRRSITLVTKKNHTSIKNFSPGLIRKLAFINDSDLEGSSFDELYYWLCKYSHPSVYMLGKNDSLNKDIYNSTLKTGLHLLNESTSIVFKKLKKYITKEDIEKFIKNYNLIIACCRPTV